ncbi:MAG: response regulator [Candidatus Omnitrophica bacterium]|nr:response regulator [Candidatus Omnitrophota bacterium]MCA9404085.1 response regulator [Candidatus Omnitrophota bacterium]MCB9721460.1 response regulator [Candidatus Omnitrophota bacterium]
MFKFLQNLFPADRKYQDRKILIVDDNEVDRKIVAKALDRLGCRVLTAVDGEIGYHVALSEIPDLILSDCHMPNMDGVEMCKRLRDHDETSNIPVIFLTGDNSPAKVIDFFDGPNTENYMCKPINPRLLASQIDEILSRHFHDDQQR